MSLFGCPGVLPECPFDQSYDTAYAKIDPFRLNADEETGPGRGSNVFNRVRESLSQKLIVPSDPQVENVPCMGWKLMSFTPNTSDWSFPFGVRSRRWHLKEKLFGESFSSTYWMATRPSTLPIAKPVLLGKQDITRVCHFNGDIIVLNGVVGFVRLKIWT